MPPLLSVLCEIAYTTQACLSSESSTLVPPTQLDTAGLMFKVNDVHSELAHSLTLLIRSHVSSFVSSVGSSLIYALMIVRKYTPCPRWPSCMPGCEFKHPLTTRASFYNHEVPTLSPTRPQPAPTAVRIRVTRKRLDSTSSQMHPNSIVNSDSQVRARRR